MEAIGSVGSTVNTTTPPAGTPPVIGRDDTLSQVGSIVGGMIGGGAASYKFSATFSNSTKTMISDIKAADKGFSNKIKAAGPSMQTLGATSLKAGGIGALISGTVSAITNGIDVLQGKKTGAEALGIFTADTVNGTLGAMTAVAAGGLATMALSGALASTPLMIVGIGVGALGAVLSDRLFKGSGTYDGIRNVITNSASQ